MEEIKMNNETIKKFNLTVKLRGDHVYDLYVDGKWVAHSGSCENVLLEASRILSELLREE